MTQADIDRNEIIEMAKQAEIDIGMWEKLSDDDNVFGYDIGGTHENLKTFAKLVADKEREACAVIADSMDACQDGEIGKAIRARGQQ